MGDSQPRYRPVATWIVALAAYTILQTTERQVLSEFAIDSRLIPDLDQTLSRLCLDKDNTKYNLSIDLGQTQELISPHRAQAQCSCRLNLVSGLLLC